MPDKCGYCDSLDITCPFCKTNYSIHKWISVEDKLPDINQPVIAYPFGPLPIRHIKADGTWYFNAIPTTHWMPLPPPPQEGE